MNKKILIASALCLMIALPSQLVLARTSSRSSSRSSSRTSSFRSSSSYSKSSTSRTTTPRPSTVSKASRAKATAYKRATKAKATASKAKVKAETKEKNYKTYNTYRITHINNNFSRPTYRTYFTPSYYGMGYSNNFWSHYWMYQAMSQHSMYPVNNVSLGSSAPAYSRWQDVITVIVCLLIVYGVYRLIRRRRNY